MFFKKDNWEDKFFKDAHNFVNNAGLALEIHGNNMKVYKEFIEIQKIANKVFIRLGNVYPVYEIMETIDRIGDRLIHSIEKILPIDSDAYLEKFEELRKVLIQL